MSRRDKNKDKDKDEDADHEEVKPDVAMIVTTQEGTKIAPEVTYGKQHAGSKKKSAKEEDPELLKIPKKPGKKKKGQEEEKKRESRQFTSIQMQVIRETFQLFDKDNDGYVSCKDIGGLLRGLGQNPTEAEIKDFIHEIDEDKDGLFDLKDFTRLMTTHMKGQEEMEDELRESFKMFDLNGDGYVSFDELRTAMLTLGEPMTDEEVKELFKLCDLNKDGKIDYEEFCKAMTNDALFK